MTFAEQKLPDQETSPNPLRQRRSQSVASIAAWLERVDPGTHRRIKGLRLVTAYGIAALLGSLPAIANGLPQHVSLSVLAGGFALWASVSEARITRRESSRDLALLVAAAVLGAVSMIALSPLLTGPHSPGPELTLATGAFLVGYLKRFGVLGGGIGSQIYIGQLLAYSTRLNVHDLPTVLVAGLIAALAAMIPRLLSGPAEHPALAPAAVPPTGTLKYRPELYMGLQAAVAALIIVALNHAIGLEESDWAITACTYVVATSRAGTIERIRRRIIGTAIGVPLGLACLPVALHAPLLIWLAAAFAMIIYAMALPERYDIACAAFAFTLIVTMAATGEHSLPLLASRAWETLLGGVVGLAVTIFLAPPDVSHPARS
jgi:hypothetical protein